MVPDHRHRSRRTAAVSLRSSRWLVLLVPKPTRPSRRRGSSWRSEAAERRLHDIARNSFQAMLEEARTHSRGRVR